jgi:GWxTD domain-containing protein
MPRRRFVTLLAFAGWLGLPAALRAQAPAERVTLDSMRARFAAVLDSSSLIALERRRIAVARLDRENPFIHMELGYVSYRLGELTSAKKRFQDAASEFQWAADLRPGWPYAWYHLGLAELLSGESELIVVENLRQLLGQDALSQAARSFARAVEVEPGFSAGLVDLANTAMRQRIAPRLLVAQSALRQAAGTAAGRVAEVQLVRGRIERRLGANDSALVAFRLYREVGGDSVIGGVEVARTLAMLDHPDSAVTVYFEATGRPPSDSARREVRKDLRWFAMPAELAAFDASRADSAGAWLRRFWIGRDLFDGRVVGERLVEQFRRYQYAVANFSLPSKRRGFDIGFAFRDTTQQDFDDRGVIYLRHGEPTSRAQYTAPGYEPNESWVYRRNAPETDLILHFVALNDVQDYRLMETLQAVCTRRFSADAFARTAVELSDIERTCVQSRAGFSGLYDRLARVGIATTDNLWATERLATMDMTREATTSDSYLLHFEQTLRPVVSLFAVADAAMRPELHLVFAVPAGRLHPGEGEAGVTYGLKLRMLVYDSASHLIAALDTVRVFRAPSRLPSGAYLTEQLALRVPAGRWRYSFVIEETSGPSGDAVRNRPIEVPVLAGAFSASDVIVGREGSGLVWRRPEGTVQLNPLLRFPRDGEAVLYYELYGLSQGAEVGTRIRIVNQGGRSLFRRLFGSRGNVDLSYTTVTDAGGRSRVRQTLNLRGLPPGQYRLEIEFTDPRSGQRVLRDSPFEIEGARAS